MAISKGRIDAGQGGKLGHSNQNHWDFTEDIKEAARQWRRLQAKQEIAEELKEHRESHDMSKSQDVANELSE